MNNKLRGSALNTFGPRGTREWRKESKEYSKSRWRQIRTCTIRQVLRTTLSSWSRGAEWGVGLGSDISSFQKHSLILAVCRAVPTVQVKRQESGYQVRCCWKMEQRSLHSFSNQPSSADEKPRINPCKSYQTSSSEASRKPCLFLRYGGVSVCCPKKMWISGLEQSSCFSLLGK